MRFTERVTSCAVNALIALDSGLAAPSIGPQDRSIDPNSQSWTVDVAAAWPDIRAELESLLESGFVMPSTDEVAGAPQGGDGEWITYLMTWFGRWIDSSTRKFPRTADVLRSVPGIQVGGFTVLGPGAHLPRHRGPTHNLRYHLGVIVPEPIGSCRLRVGEDVIEWTEGAGVMFDDRAPHEAWNDSEESRYVLFVQTRLQVRGWRGPFHRATQQALGATTSGIYHRAARLDRELNPD